MLNMWMYYVEEEHEGKLMLVLRWTVNLAFSTNKCNKEAHKIY